MRFAFPIVLLWSLAASVAVAQAPDPATPGSPADGAAGGPDAEAAPAAEAAAAPEASRVEALETRVGEQQAALDAQREALEALRARVDESAHGAAAAEKVSDAEVAAFLESADVPVAEGDVLALAEPEPLRFYGYMDMGLQRVFADEDFFLDQVVPSNETTFVFGNVNLYMLAQPTPDWRALTEVRFTNLAHGEERDFELAGSSRYQRVDRTVRNATSPDGRDQIRLGSIFIERAFIEWQRHPEFQVRVGQFLTPFGIWNIDHGMPVLIGLLQPDFQISQVFPARQLGVQMLGAFGTGDWSLGYHATVSNGRMASQFDFSDDKALGGRVHATHRGDGITTKLGLSGYWGTVEDQKKRITSVSPTIALERVKTIDGTEYMGGGDLSVDVGPFRFRTEGVVARIEYESGLHAPASFGPPGSTQPNRYYLDGYALVGYRLPWWGLEPTMYYELRHAPGALGDTSNIVAPGLNVYFGPSVQLKLMYAMIYFQDLSGEDTLVGPNQRLDLALSRLVLAF